VKKRIRIIIKIRKLEVKRSLLMCFRISADRTNEFCVNSSLRYRGQRIFSRGIRYLFTYLS